MFTCICFNFFGRKIFICAQAYATCIIFPCACNCAVVALNTILGRWGLKASPAWNISGEPCSGVAVDNTNVDNNPNINPAIKCDCTYNNATVCHITKL